MPKRTDIKSILIIGSGPIVIGQACEFDYSGVQACKALKADGFKVILVNSNPATIMTDPELADRTYIEPIDPDIIEKIIEKEKPDAVLPTLGGQTALNCAVALWEKGVFKKHNVEMIGAKGEVIKKAEDRDLFKKAMQKIGLDLPRSGLAHTYDEALKVAEEIGFPVIIRPAFTLGGTGGGTAYNLDEFEVIAKRGLEASPITEILVEESIIGWKEFEMEVMRDLNDNVVIICSIENFDAMGVHTGDSITVAPAQTLTDKEYQLMRDASIAVIREIGVETGGSNIQFAVNPQDGRMVIIEMNPRVSRSSALASKATGFPIAKMAAKLAVGYSLDEIPNDITQKTPACFEPTIDYVVTKIPRFTFEKFPGADPTLTISMKSVGEAMSIGRTFKESFQKGLRSLETKWFGFEGPQKEAEPAELEQKLRVPGPERVLYLKQALQQNYSIAKLNEMTGIDPWFLDNLLQIVEFEAKVKEDKTLLAEAKAMGFSDHQLGRFWGMTEPQVFALRKEQGIIPEFKLVDTCAAEFEAYTPYYYSTYSGERMMRDGGGMMRDGRGMKKDKVMVLGGGPNRIGQGIEFDYCCCHASFAIKEEGLEAIMVNSNPETVSTDFDTSDRLYFEPLTREDVLHIYEKEEPRGAIVQFGGQTPLNLAHPLESGGVKILGTSVDSIDRAEDRKRFKSLLNKLKLFQPDNGTAISTEQAIKVAKKIGYPVVVRPSYVLGGRAMMIVYDETDLREYMEKAVIASPERPILIDKFLEDAIEVDVDCVADGKQVVICGIMEHIEEAGIHSGDSACSIPTFSLSKAMLAEIRRATEAMAKQLKVKGLMNTQYAVKGDKLFVLEVNPRASRTVPYVSKATGIPWAKVATKVMLGISLKEQGIEKEIIPEHFSVKEAVFPFNRFPGVDPVLGPEMKSTGEVMGIDSDLGVAYMKAQLAAGQKIPLTGKVFISVNDNDKRKIVAIAKLLAALGYQIVSTSGTAEVLRKNGLECEEVAKLAEGRPNVLDLIKNGEIKWIINTPGGKQTKLDEARIRSAAIMHSIPLVTTLSGARATVNGLEAVKKKGFSVKALQSYHAQTPRTKMA